MADKRKSILLRISGELYDELSRWAAGELRSTNAQIEFVLREAVRRQRRARDETPTGSANSGSLTPETHDPRGEDATGA